MSHDILLLEKTNCISDILARIKFTIKIKNLYHIDKIHVKIYINLKYFDILLRLTKIKDLYIFIKHR
jgi:hypothetical protein